MTLRQQASRTLRAFDGFVAFRHVQHEGFGNAWRRWRLWTKVLDLPAVHTEDVSADASLEVHLVCCLKDYLCALWALKTFYFAAGVSYPLVVHLNGTMTTRALSRLRTHLPNARILEQQDIDGTVINWLVNHNCPRLQQVRSKNGFMLKLVDVNLLSEAPRLLVLDSDVLFFRRPDELLSAVRGTADGMLFQRDADSTYNLTLEEARTELGIDLAPRVNTGIMLFAKSAVDLCRCEALLEHPAVARHTGWIEQTLYALVASERDSVRYLSADYLVSLEPEENLASLTARHYAGPSRRYLTEEGLPFALQTLREGGAHHQVTGARVP